MERERERLTNENLTKKFKSNFELVSYAIKLAENMIKTGRDARVRADTQNRAMLVLEEIAVGKDQFDTIGELSKPASASALIGESFTGELSEQLVQERRYKTRHDFDEHEE